MKLKNLGSPGIPVVTGQNSLSRRARPLEILGRPLNDVLFSREFRESPNLLALLLILLIVIALQVSTGTAIYWVFDTWQDRAFFGDMSGAVNTLFSGLAFAGLIYTLLLQRQELELQREEIKRYREVQQAKYLHINIDVTSISKDYVLARATIENYSEEPKEIENALLLVAPEYKGLIKSFNRLAETYNFSKRADVTNDIADFDELTESKYSEGRALLPIPFFYRENIRIADERLSYQVPIKISEMEEGTPYSIRFFVRGEKGRYHRTTHDSFVVPHRNDGERTAPAQAL